MTTTPIPDYPRFPTVSPVPTLSHGCECLSVIAEASTTHLLRLAWSLSPDSHTVPITPTHHLNAQPQVIPNPDDLGFDFLTAAGNFSLPPVHPPPACYPSYEARELTRLSNSHKYSVLTTHGIVWPQCSQSGPSHFGTPFDWVTVSWPAFIVSFICLRNFVGYHFT